LISAILFLIFLVGLVIVFNAQIRVRSVEKRLSEIERRLPPAPETSKLETPEREPPPASESAAPRPTPAQAAPQPKKWKPLQEPDRRSFEERFGTRWAVWVGGVALALGGIFLVQYSIEQGLIGPGMRILLGALLAAALIVAGEWA
jgi:uncharacterized membrane protein